MCVVVCSVCAPMVCQSQSIALLVVVWVEDWTCGGRCATPRVGYFVVNRINVLSVDRPVSVSMSSPRGCSTFPPDSVVMRSALLGSTVGGGHLQASVSGKAQGPDTSDGAVYNFTM